MTDLRTAAQQALEALESCQDGDYTTGDVRQSFDEQAVNAAIVALWAALAEPNHDYERGFVEGMSEQARRSVDKAVNAMAERKPLTDEEIKRLWYDNGAGIELSRFSSIARAVERALEEEKNRGR